MYLYNSATRKKAQFETHTPDPIAAELAALRERIETLEKLLEEK